VIFMTEGVLLVIVVHHELVRSGATVVLELLITLEGLWVDLVNVLCGKGYGGG
jgi:hypothetical protein